MIDRRSFFASAMSAALCKSASSGILAAKQAIGCAGHPDLLALLVAAKEKPADDKPRLALAEWLDNHGAPERAKFVRIQIEHSRVSHDTERSRKLDGEQTRLILRFRDRWLGSLPAGLVQWAQFERGLVRLVIREAEELEIAALTNVWPWVQIVRVDRDPWEATSLSFLRDFLTSPSMALVRELEWHTLSMNDAGAAILAQSPRAGGLLKLDLSGNELGPRGAAALACSRRFGSLAELDLSLNHIGDEGTVAITSASWLPLLVSLSLNGNDIGDRGVIALTEARNLQNLRELDVSMNKIGPKGQAALRSFAHRRAVKVGLLWGELIELHADEVG
jgi:uncharacterized protein (TIGR02996 family)